MNTKKFLKVKLECHTHVIVFNLQLHIVKKACQNSELNLTCFILSHRRLRLYLSNHVAYSAVVESISTSVFTTNDKYIDETKN